MMNYVNKLFLLTLTVITTSCGFWEPNRTFVDIMDEQQDPFFVANRDFRTVGGDSGTAHRTTQEVMERTPMDEEERASVLADKRLNAEFQRLLMAQSDYARRHYMRNKHYFNNLSEKIYFLKLGSLSERNEYLHSMGAPVRSSGRGLANYVRRTQEEVFVGMGKMDVVNAWGRPMRVDVAGDPARENERWTFMDGGNLKFVYFERGQVQGWTTP